MPNVGLHLKSDLYSESKYSVESVSGKYLENGWSDQHEDFSVEFVMEKLTTLFFCTWWPFSDLQLWFSWNALHDHFFTPDWVGLCRSIGHKVCPATIFMTILFCIACNGGYSGWVLSASPTFKSLHHYLTFNISSECIKFNRYMTSSYRDICVKVTPQSIWIHCRFLFGLDESPFVSCTLCILD